MPKDKDKKARIPESKLLKAIAELDAQVDADDGADVEKGDALEEADPEGGLSTEGKPLSDSAPSGRGDGTKKSRGRSSGTSVNKASSSASSSSDDDDDGDDDASVSAPPFPPKGKKVKKGEKADKSKKGMAYSMSASESGDDDDDGDDDSSGAEKSFREIAEGDETMRKGIVINDFLESMVDQLSLALYNMGRHVAKSLKDIEGRLSARIDESVAKGFSSQQNFNVRLAKAVSAIGATVQDDLLGMVDMVKALADQPVSQPRGKAVLTKGEINQPPWGAPGGGSDPRLAGGSDDGQLAELREIPTKAIADWLYKKSANNQIDPNVLIAWEADRYDVGALPTQVRKALADELIK